MRIAFLVQGLPHYFVHVLNRLNAVPGLEVVAIVPSQPLAVEKGVFLTEEGARFRVLKLSEGQWRSGDLFLAGLWRVLWRERPRILFVTPPHLRGLVFHLPTLCALKLLRVRVVLKSIPFRVPTYAELCAARMGSLAEVLRVRSPVASRLARAGGRLPGAAGRLAGRVLGSGIERLRGSVARGRVRFDLAMSRFFWRFPDAHVNYVESARTVYGSYGVAQERIFVTRNSPDTDALAVARDAVLREPVPPVRHSHRVLHVGRLVDWKRVDLLLEAVARLVPEFPDAEVVIVGGGPREDAWKERARQLAIGDRVQWLGPVYGPRELGRIYLSSAVYVLAGMGGVSINEAMCFGLPVICSVCDGTERDLVQDGVNGLFFREGDAADLAAKIRRVLADPSTAQDMGRAGLAVIRDRINAVTVLRGYLAVISHLGGRSFQQQEAGHAGP